MDESNNGHMITNPCKIATKRRNMLCDVNGPYAIIVTSGDNKLPRYQFVESCMDGINEQSLTNEPVIHLLKLHSYLVFTQTWLNRS